jgi:hypothetical protein
VLILDLGVELVDKLNKGVQCGVRPQPGEQEMANTESALYPAQPLGLSLANRPL